MEKLIESFKDIDGLSSGDFEIFVSQVFTAAGWTNCEITKPNREYEHGDGGVDIFAIKEKRHYAIEVKQRGVGNKVSVKDLNQLVTGATLAKVNNRILVTNSFFTSEVETRALKLGVELINRNQLHNLWLAKHSEIGRQVKPRKYQQEIIDESINLYESGKNKLLIEMATGLGKTYTVAFIIKDILNKNPHFKVLVIAHQIEILLQSVTAFKNIFGIGAYSFSACFGGATPEDSDFVFGTFDTIYTNLKGLQKTQYDIIVVDEAHHVPARTYSEVVKNFQPKLLIGLTATPFRTDAKDVLGIFGGPDANIGKYDLLWALKHRKLAFPKYEVLLNDLDSSKIDQLQKNLSIVDIDKHLFLHKKDEEVVNIIENKIIEKNISSPKAIVFCRSIKHINYLIKFFTQGSATFVHSKNTDQERRDNIRSFREGGHKYILTCNLFNEGIDIPETNILIFLRSTNSRIIWLQQPGRGLRKIKGKDFVNVFDFVGSLERLNEVLAFRDEYKKIALDNDEIEEGDKKLDCHDNTIKVTFSSSAAKVLKLIKEQKFYLAKRNHVISRIRFYHEKHGEIPKIEKINDIFEDISPDQILTIFDSYFGLIRDTFSPITDEDFDWDYRDYFKARIDKEIKNFMRQFGIPPDSEGIISILTFYHLPFITKKQLFGLYKLQMPFDKYAQKQFNENFSLA